MPPCWECERTDATLVEVLLDLDGMVFGPLSLCPACYRSCYLPIAHRARACHCRPRPLACYRLDFLPLAAPGAR